MGNNFLICKVFLFKIFAIALHSSFIFCLSQQLKHKIKDNDYLTIFLI